MAIDLNNITPKGLVEAFRHAKKKSLGQNFLIDENVTRCIAKDVERFNPTHILEIGPGVGALTAELTRHGLPITAIEKDDTCAAFLRQIFADRVEIIAGDALEVDMPACVSDPSQRTVLVSNLPYNVASQIYFRFIDEGYPLVGMVLMFQREVAQRFLATPGHKSYGILSVIGQYYHDIEEVLEVPPEAFVPAPKITSTVLRFFPRPKQLSQEESQNLRILVRTAFAQRRKTLANSLSGFKGCDRDTWSARLVELGHKADVRAERLSVQDFIALL